MQKPDTPILCYVTDRRSFPASASADPVKAVLEKVRFSIEAGADWIQIREKDLSGRQLLALASETVALTRHVATRSGEKAAARIYVNDRLDIALAAGAAASSAVAGLPAAVDLPVVAGVHLGGESLPVADVVRWCRSGNAPRGFQVGVSCHSLDRAREAERDGADYIFFGPVFDTPSKRPFGAPQGLDRLNEVCRAIRIPVIAIGGIDESNAHDCIRAGASGIAAIRFFQESTNAEQLRQAIGRMRAAD